MNEMTRSPSGLTVAAFAVAVTLGGANFLAVRLSNRELPPFWGAGLRFSLAALLFVVIAVTLRLRWPRGRQLVLTAVYGLWLRPPANLHVANPGKRRRQPPRCPRDRTPLMRLRQRLTLPIYQARNKSSAAPLPRHAPAASPFSFPNL
jgi:hypothetical protein